MKTQRLFDTARSCGCEILMNEPLCGHTTFKIGGNCTALIEVNSTESLRKLLDAARADSVRTFVLGKGSNVLFADEGFDGVVLHIASEMSEVRLLGETSVFAQAGCSMMKLCRFALENSLTGLEFAYGIPGTVGGAVFMNAGAYGGEIKDVIKSASVVNTRGELEKLTNAQLDLSYRHSSIMQTGGIVCDAVFELQKGDRAQIESKMNELMGRRRDKQPIEFPSAGSTFKRPEGYFAGKLIQDSGLRGFTVGGAQVSEKHCGFVINKGGATSRDVVSLIEQVQKIVQEKTGQFLECEVRIIPFKQEV
ncbi:MAG: UDP-N-acetylmuramate dehydrogenase [Ruminococcus sp.]|nr:UDP-N-acetylmuramate dehydrogenase [Ruminococcus sp.]